MLVSMPDTEKLLFRGQPVKRPWLQLAPLLLPNILSKFSFLAVITPRTLHFQCLDVMFNAPINLAGFQNEYVPVVLFPFCHSFLAFF